VTVETDLVVVGGGIIGCFAAHRAARDQRVVLLEQAEIGCGATAWSAGVSFPLAATSAHRPLVRDSAVGYELLRGTEAARFLRPVPMVYVVGDHGFRGRVVGTGLRTVTAAERRRVERMLPGLRIARGEELLTHDGHGFAVDARGLARWLVADGVTVHTGHEVAGVHPDGDGYLVSAEGTEWFARRVVVATGPWTGPRPVEPVVRTKWVAALHADLDTEPGDPLVYIVDDDLFFLPRPTGETLVSFYRDVWDVDPTAATGRPDDEDLRVGTEAVRRRCPAAAEAVTGGQAFCDSYAPDRLPLVTTHRPGLVSVRGGSGSGVRLAPALAASALRAIDHATADRVGRR
jgi:D-arginine dehydrogenase